MAGPVEFEPMISGDHEYCRTSEKHSEIRRGSHSDSYTVQLTVSPEILFKNFS